MTFKKIVRQGEMYPKFYGTSWNDFSRNEAHCHPWPLNIIIGELRAAWFEIRYYHNINHWEQLNKEIEHKIGEREMFIRGFK